MQKIYEQAEPHYIKRFADKQNRQLTLQPVAWLKHRNDSGDDDVRLSFDDKQRTWEHDWAEPLYTKEQVLKERDEYAQHIISEAIDEIANSFLDSHPGIF